MFIQLMHNAQPNRPSAEGAVRGVRDAQKDKQHTEHVTCVFPMETASAACLLCCFLVLCPTVH